MKVLVTGGAGYIGSHTVQELIKLNHEVIVLDTLENGNRAAVPENVKFIEGSMADKTLLDSLLPAEKPDAVIHFAAYKKVGESVEKPSMYFNNNVCGTLILLDAMVRHKINNFIFSSTCAVYGTPKNVPVTETNNFLAPESPYGETKLMVEKILQWYEIAYGLHSVSLRYFNVAGASLDGSIGEDWATTTVIVPLVLKAALGYAPAARINGTDYPTPDGTCIRDYIHVVDLAVAHVLAMDWLVANKRSEAFNLATGKGDSVREVVNLCKQISGVDFKVDEVGRRPGDAVAIWADSTKAQQLLGWKPQYNLEDMIQTAWNWHKAHPNGYNK
jgi:UDP-glucose 4-epimerase